MESTKQRVDKKDIDGKRGIKSFVLRTNSLSEYQKEALIKYSDTYTIPFKEELIDYSAIYKNNNPLIIEIGFGMGDATKEIAMNKRDKNFLAIEVFLSGFTKLLSYVGENKVENLRLMRFDAVSVLQDMIRDESVSGFHIFFPDPWPKKRQQKRRLIQPEFVNLLSKKLVKGGYIYCVTDWKEYAQQMVDVFETCNSLINPHKDYSNRVEWRPTTSFEKKGLEKGHEIKEIWVEKKVGEE